MKRFLLLAGAGALCTLAMFVIYCTEVTFENPLDEIEKGRNQPDSLKWLWDIDDTACVSLSLKTVDGINKFPPGFTDCGNYIRNYYFNPNVDTTIKKAWRDTLSGCVGKNTPPTISRVGPNSVTLYYDDSTLTVHPPYDSALVGFEKWMVNTAIPWEGIVTYTGDPTTITAVLTRDGTPNTVVTVPSGKMPSVGSYIILYTATKLKCGSNNEYLPSATDVRTVIIKDYVADNTTPPDIFFCGSYPNPTEITRGKQLNATESSIIGGSEVGNCVTALNGGSVPVRTINGAPGIIDTTKTGTITITYTTTKTLIRNGVSKDTSVTKTRTVVVKDEEVKPGNDPQAVIVLNNYTYMIDGKPFSSPDTAFPKNGGSFREPGLGAVSAYYPGPTGAQVSIAPSLVIRTEPTEYKVMDGGNPVSYNLEAVAGQYSKPAASVSRVVYITEGCGQTTITFNFRSLTGQSMGADKSLTIPKGTAWANPQRSCLVFEEDEEGDLPVTYLFGIDFGTLDPNNPQPATYKITYIALSICSGSAPRFVRSPERTVIVQP